MRASLVAVVVASGVTGLVAGCGTILGWADFSGDGGASAHEAGTPNDVGVTHDTGFHQDTGTHDTGASHNEASPDVAVGTGPPTPTGMALDKGAARGIRGITDDGYVIYFTDTAVNAVLVTGGTPIPIVSVGDGGVGSAEVLVIHDNVFVWTNINTFIGAGALTFWTHTLSTPTELAAASIAGLAETSADSSAIMYTSGTSGDGATSALLGAKTTALASPVTLAPSINSSGECAFVCSAVRGGRQACPALINFTGTASPFHAVASYCLLSDAGAPGPVSAYSYPTTTWAPKLLATNANYFWLDSTGTSTAISLASGALETEPVPGGTAVPIDPTSLLGTPPYDAYLSRSDAFVLYVTADGALKTSTVTASAPKTLVSANVGLIDAVSPDEAWALVTNTTDMSNGLLNDLSLASTATAMTPASALPTQSPAAAAIRGDPFTADSTYALYMAGITTDVFKDRVGTLSAVATAAPSKLIPLATAAISNFLFSPSDLALTGAKIVYTDNFIKGTSGANGSVDLHVIDLSQASPSMIAMSRANPFFAVSFDKKYIVYTITYGGDTDGLYAVAVP